MEIIILAFLTCISFLVLFVKFFGWRNTLRFQKLIDIAVTIGLMFLFRGTFSGIATAIIAGVMMSLILSTISKGQHLERKTSN